jgi:hypothetical protein
MIIYICIITKNQYNKLIANLSIIIYNIFLVYIFNNCETEINMFYKKINKNIMKDLLYIKK